MLKHRDSNLEVMSMAEDPPVLLVRVELLLSDPEEVVVVLVPSPAEEKSSPPSVPIALFFEPEPIPLVLVDER